MNRYINTLNKYARNIKSQNGEDGILEHIFNAIGEESKRCVEFGAWDGKHLSNTWNLIVNEGWEGIYIESDRKKYKALFEKWRGNKKVVTINSKVESGGSNLLDNILKDANIPKQIDLLSIDVDGNEWHTWNSIKEYMARVVIIEHNPTIPPHIELIGYEGNTNIGASVLALYNLGKRKGYELICCTATNSIFVLKELFNLLNIRDNSPEKLMQREHFTYVISTYDEQLIFSKKTTYYHCGPFLLKELKRFVRTKVIKRKKLAVHSDEDLYEMVPLYYKKITDKCENRR